MEAMNLRQCPPQWSDRLDDLEEHYIVAGPNLTALDFRN